MKNILLTTIVLFLMSCASQKKLETTNIPFKIGQSIYQKSLGGREKTGTTAQLKIVISEESNAISFEKIYFRGRALDCLLKTEDYLSILMASYKSNETTNGLDKDGLNMKETFKLQPNQAIISFKKADGKLKYVKVLGIKEKTPIVFKNKPQS